MANKSVKKKSASSSREKSRTKNSPRKESRGKKSSERARTDQAPRVDHADDSGIPMYNEIQMIASIGIMVIMMLSNFGLCGYVGKALSSFFFGVFGIVQYVMPVAFCLGVFILIANDYSLLSIKKCTAGFVTLIMISAFTQIIYQGDPVKYTELFSQAIEDHRAGGILGGGFAMILKNGFGSAGALVIIICCLLLALIMLTQRSFVGFFQNNVDRGGKFLDKIRENRRITKELRQEERKQRLEEAGEDPEAEEGGGRRASFFRSKNEKNIPEEPEETDRAKQVEEKLKEIEQNRSRRGRGRVKSAQAAKERLEGVAEKNRSVPVFTSSEEVGKKDAVKELHPEIYPFTANDAKSSEFEGKLDFSAFSFSSGKSPEEFAEDMAKDSRELDSFLGSLEEYVPSGRSQAGSSLSELSPADDFEDLAEDDQTVDDHADWANQGDQDGQVGQADQTHQADQANRADQSRQAGQANRADQSRQTGRINRTDQTRQAGQVKQADQDGFVAAEIFPEEVDDILVDIEEENDSYSDAQTDDWLDLGADARNQTGNRRNNRARNRAKFSAGNRVNVQADIQPDMQAQAARAQAGAQAKSQTAQAQNAQNGSQGNTQSAQTQAAQPQNAKTQAGAQAQNRSQASATRPKAKRTASGKDYLFPPVTLLSQEENIHSDAYDREIRETAAKLQSTLESFGVNVMITDISCGPSVTRYEMVPEQGTKVSKIVSLTDDIKLNLAAADIRIEAPIPGKAAIGIEVPNKQTIKVHLKELIDNRLFRSFRSRLAFAVGKDIGGNPVITDLAKMPHLLIAGATGSGKSVCINTLIMSLLYKATPEEVKLIMIDPKMVELNIYNGIPHLLIPVVTDPKKASGALNWAVAEMTDRYKKFAESNVRNLEGYNKKVDQLLASGEVDDEKLKRMPQIVIIIDELADLMMVAPGEVEDAIVRLSQLARAAGIHLVIATQRPSVNVITGLIKANVPSRIAFSVSSGVDSRTIIDMNGAEKLLGKGDMLFYPAGYQKPVRVQGALVEDSEVAQVVEFIKNNEDMAVYDNTLSDTIEKKLVNNEALADRDEYFEAAARFIMEKDKATIGMLQRMFKIGFNRAARIMDQLAEAGIVGPEEGTKPRQILMSPEQLDQFFEENF